jgi:hypothetical protein
VERKQSSDFKTILAFKKFKGLPRTCANNSTVHSMASNRNAEIRMNLGDPVSSSGMSFVKRVEQRHIHDSNKCDDLT